MAMRTKLSETSMDENVFLSILMAKLARISLVTDVN